MSTAQPRSSVREVAGYFLRLGALGFGGPVALVGQMERDLVEQRHWLSAAEMRDAIAVCQTLPGPLAIQVGILIAYMRTGVVGAIIGGWCFILPNFLIVAALGALYVAYGDLPWITAVFYGVAPAVIALIVHATWRLSKLGMQDRLQWLLAAAAFAATVVLRAEVAAIFIAAGLIGLLFYGNLFRGRTPGMMAAMAVNGASGPASSSAALQILAFFLKAGSLTFGSGLVIVPFLEQGVVRDAGWLDERQFLIAIAIGMMSPGPVVITATFVGYLVAGFLGALLATVGIFLPSFVFVLLIAPLLIRHRAHPNVNGFVRGAYAAAIGTIAGAAVLLGQIAIGDVLTGAIAVLSLAALVLMRIPTPALILVTAVIGLVAFPILEPTWIHLK